MKLLWALLAAAAPAWAGPQADILLVQAFRARVQLPALNAMEVAKLAKNPAELNAIKLESAQAFLAGINPHFDATITNDSRFLENPATLEIKRDVAAARRVLVEANIQVHRDTLMTDGAVDPEKLDAVFNGSKSLANSAKALGGAGGKTISELILDGAPGHARSSLDAYAKQHAWLKKNEGGKAVVERLRRGLSLEKTSSPVLEFQRRLETIAVLYKKREYGAAVLAARNLFDALAGTPFREGTRRALWTEAALLEEKARVVGARSIYSRRGDLHAVDLAKMIADGKLPYKGDPIVPEKTRVQCHSDCAVQQLYNHPKVAPAKAVIGYRDFLDAATAVIDSEIKDQGMGDVDTRWVLQRLGLKPVFRRAQSEDQLLEALETHGALITTIRWEPGDSPLANMRGNHAVVLQGAFLEDGKWRYVMIDSNSAKPQVMSYGELLVLGARRFESVEPLEDKELSPELRGLPDVESRVRAGAAELLKTWTPKGQARSWWNRLWAALFG